MATGYIGLFETIALWLKALWPLLLIRGGGKYIYNIHYASKPPQFGAATETKHCLTLLNNMIYSY